MCSRQQQKRRSKHMANIGPVGMVMKQRNERETDNCPRCKESESNIHIFTCVGAGSDEIFNNAMETVQEWLDKGPKHLALAITELIHAHRYNYELDWHINNDPETRKVMRQQWRMGEISLIWGFFHTDWKKIIDEYLHGTRQPGARWLAILSTRIWSVTESMWKHRNEIEHGNDKNNLLSQDRHDIKWRN